MFSCHVSSVVASIGDAEAMPAFETRMSRPPYSAAANAIDAVTDASSRTSQTTPRTLSAPNALPSAARVSSSAA